ncbi:MAG: site-2 protease family protein [Defluviitaleaceae bacterium]|nr:site-2 protease family protein [Defluviitaleaceae bacterium]
MVGSVIGFLFRIILALFSLYLHEWAHVFVARGYGAKVERIRLSVFGMFARVRRMDNLHPRQRSFVYFSGPLANIMVAAWAYTVHHLSYVGVIWLFDLALINAVIAIFNLLPLLPLDGGRLVQHFLGNRFGILPANRFMLRFGRVFSVVLAVLGIIQIILFSYNITLLCAAIFLWRKNMTMQTQLRMECFLTLQKKPALLRGPRGKHRYRIKTFAVPAEMPIQRAVERFGWSYMCEFTVEGKPVREEEIMSFIFSPYRPSISESLAMPIAALV